MFSEVSESLLVDGVCGDGLDLDDEIVSLGFVGHG